MRLLNGTPLALDLPEAFLYHGASVFTTLRAEGGRPLWLEEHLARLRRHALALGLFYPGDEAFLEDLEALLRAFPDAPCLRLRLTVGEGVRLSEARPYAPLPPSLYREGVRVRLTGYRVHPDLARYKTGNYLPYRLALEEARKEGAFEGLLLDASGHVVDGSRTSPLLFREGTLFLLEGGLEGITREKVAEAARGLGLRVERVRLGPEGLRGHLLLAGSGVGLLPVGPPPVELLPLIERFRPACYTE
ncbi:branched-chain amino acid aminotransferase/4-amino-4-deoxychorismate lyase [Thermus thermophilus]|uniref:aminotransferase class IV n=1 Tax=Thermus thermophilus TaxID=274 RepID=UPI00090BE2E6|nr:aminotransferase class IV [Thermus thermophilus]BAW01183.1 branched-chain amino acid aminotransferase/4-amino-4-deoxychorismate lyase [Thermus thermophilus]BDB11850.1 4-amino-4-deoxychorismate lyase [Thermus thermophilus]